MRILRIAQSRQGQQAGAPPSTDRADGDVRRGDHKSGRDARSEGLQPTSKSKRVRLAKGKVTLIDGPFAESKEVIASYALFQVASMDEAIKWTTRFLEVLGQGECELRPIYEASDFPADVLSPEQAAHEETVRREMLKNAAKR